jgi:DNA polymerase-3 subunit gamma/tau
MLNGQVLALKYRPKNFDELIGQETVAITLKNTLKNHKRLAHAYLFSGLRGSGKTSSARIFAKTLLCEKAPVDIACEECASCQMANNNSHIDIIEIDGASNRKIEDIRDLIQQTKYRPSIGNFKIFIIDEVHMLTKEAFNALLKTLEEPPEYVKFILATTDPMKLPQTILSRTQHFHFKRINPNLIKLHLQKILKLEKVEFEEEALDIIIRSGEGSLRDTLTILQQAILFCDNNLQTKLVINMLGLINPDILREIFQLINIHAKTIV